ncbi:hypothetical protein B7494_g6417 [Chlorociboria aeruginascens]|nr:hypothetical protein B7494_g6417 [Chlorociboria aeruginascens]
MLIADFAQYSVYAPLTAVFEETNDQQSTTALNGLLTVLDDEEVDDKEMDNEEVDDEEVAAEEEYDKEKNDEGSGKMPSWINVELGVLQCADICHSSLSLDDKFATEKSQAGPAQDSE